MHGVYNSLQAACSATEQPYVSALSCSFELGLRAQLPVDVLRILSDGLALQPAKPALTGVVTDGG